MESFIVIITGLILVYYCAEKFIMVVADFIIYLNEDRNHKCRVCESWKDFEPSVYGKEDEGHSDIHVEDVQYASLDKIKEAVESEESKQKTLKDSKKRFDKAVSDFIYKETVETKTKKPAKKPKKKVKSDKKRP